jgi:hypothetical protein
MVQRVEGHAAAGAHESELALLAMMSLVVVLVLVAKRAVGEERWRYLTTNRRRQETYSAQHLAIVRDMVRMAVVCGCHSSIVFFPESMNVQTFSTFGTFDEAVQVYDEIEEHYEHAREKLQIDFVRLYEEHIAAADKGMPLLERTTEHLAGLGVGEATLSKLNTAWRARFTSYMRGSNSIARSLADEIELSIDEWCESHVGSQPHVSEASPSPPPGPSSHVTPGRPSTSTPVATPVGARQHFGRSSAAPSQSGSEEPTAAIQLAGEFEDGSLAGEVEDGSDAGSTAGEVEDGSDAGSTAGEVEVTGVTGSGINELMANCCFTIGCRRQVRMSVQFTDEHGYVSANICCEPCLNGQGHSPECEANTRRSWRIRRPERRQAQRSSARLRPATTPSTTEPA